MKRYLLLVALMFSVLPTSAQSREIYPLNDGWRFFFKSDNSSDNARCVSLPHSWNNDPMAGSAFLETTATYLNDIYVPLDWSSRRIFVRFHGAQSTADVFMNGNFVGQHRGGGVAFTFELTDKIKFGAENSLLVIVSNSYRDDTLPTSTDINLYGGITRPAELIVTPRTAISPLYYGSDGVLVHPTAVSPERVEGSVEVHLTAKSELMTTLSIDIASSDGTVRFSKQVKPKLDGKPVSIPFAIENPALWSPATPALYRVTARLGEGETTDSVTVRTGFRDIRVSTPDGFTLNGERIPVQGVVLYHDNLTAAGTLTPTDYDIDLGVISELGANALRSAVMPHGQYLYDRCDEEGIMAWIDLPLHRTTYLGDVAYYATPAFEQNGEQLLREIVAQNMNHPSVVMWGLFSRLWHRGDNPLAYVRRLNDIAHQMDPSRPTVACSDQDGDINFVTDLIVWLQDIGWRRGSTDDLLLWRDLLQKNWSHLRSGVTYGGSGFRGHGEDGAGVQHRANRMPEQAQRRFHEEYVKNLAADSLFWGRWVANMFDYGSTRRVYGLNGEGLVTIDRRHRKDAFYLYRAMWNRDVKTLHLAGRDRVRRQEGLTTLDIYSSEGEPFVMLDADTVVMQAYSPCHYRADSVVLTQGERVLRFSAGELRDSVTLRIGNDLRRRPMPVPQQTTGLQTTN